MAASPQNPGRADARRRELFERHARRDHGLAAEEAWRLVEATAAVRPALRAG